MSHNNQRDLVNSIVKVAQAAFNSEAYFIQPLASRARKLAEQYPNDATSVAICNFLNKRAESSLTITRGDLRSAYDSVYSRNNHFMKAFAQELGITEIKEEEKPVIREDKDLMEMARQAVDQTMVTQLQSVVDNQPIQYFTEETQTEAKKVCARELNGCGLMPKKINASGIDQNTIVCEAVYETPKGARSILIPVEIKNGKVLIPYKFATQSGFVDLMPKNITEYIHSTIENKPSELGKELDTSKIIDKQAVAEFSAQLKDKTGEAEFIFGRDLVEKGRGLIEQELKLAGYKNSQICVDGVAENTIKYAVKIGTNFGFSVPVTAKDKSVTLPKVIVASGKPYDFSMTGINKMMVEGRSDFSVVAKVSGLYNLKPGELIDQIKEAVLADNYYKAEDALTMLKNCDSPGAYQLGYQMYVDGLSGKLAKTASVKEEPVCKDAIKTPNSFIPLCPHTGLTIDKVAKDKHGHCIPASRKHEHLTEPATFMNAKILGVI